MKEGHLAAAFESNIKLFWLLLLLFLRVLVVWLDQVRFWKVFAGDQSAKV